MNHYVYYSYENLGRCYVSIEHPCESGALGVRQFFDKYVYIFIRGLWNK